MRNQGSCVIMSCLVLAAGWDFMTVFHKINNRFINTSTEQNCDLKIFSLIFNLIHISSQIHHFKTFSP